MANGYDRMGTADFNGEGGRDYVLYNGGTRRTAIWYLNNNVFIGGAYGPHYSSGLEPGRAMSHRLGVHEAKPQRGYRAAFVGADLARVFAVQFQGCGNFVQNQGDFTLYRLNPLAFNDYLILDLVIDLRIRSAQFFAKAKRL
jgi:hypothetical protein